MLKFLITVGIRVAICCVALITPLACGGGAAHGLAAQSTDVEAGSPNTDPNDLATPRPSADGNGSDVPSNANDANRAVGSTTGL